LINTIFHGDCVQVMESFPSESVDLVVTSPPYDNLRTYQGFSLDFEKCAQELYRIIKTGGGNCLGGRGHDHRW
jgi:site-specific DNA-methyltransferase (adenine-specific)